MAVSIALILLLGLGVDHLFKKTHLPGLLGMLLVGVVCGPYVLNIIEPELLRISSELRMVALVIILLRAGLGLRRQTLNKVSGTALRMATLPSLVEGGVIVLLAPLLFGISYLEGAILGFVVAAVSPAVVVPYMLDFMGRGLGTQKGIPTIILSAGSVDNAFVILIFSILLGMYGGVDVSLPMQLLKIPESILSGILLGAAVGFVLHRLFGRFGPRATKMTITVVALSVLLTWLERKLQGTVALSALLGVMTVGFVLLEKSEDRAHQISSKLSKVWIFAEILLFVLVGAQVNLHVAWGAGLAGALLIFLALVARAIATWLCVAGAGLTAKERLFCVVAYVPKATVQAAIGAVPLEAGLASGETILAVAVLAILLTAPLGAVGILYAGDRWLQQEGASGPGLPGKALPKEGVRI